MEKLTELAGTIPEIDTRVLCNCNVRTTMVEELQEFRKVIITGDQMMKRPFIFRECYRLSKWILGG